jgi:hypothetical protein
MEHQKNIQRAQDQNQSQDYWSNVHTQLQQVQKKSMTINDPDDDNEKEADTIARKVVNGEEATINGSSNGINRKGEGTAEASPQFQSQLAANKGGGQSLPGDVQQEMGGKMGEDFSGVKVHTGGEANSMSDSINAKAFTSGNDVFFNKGEYNTDSKQGKELLAHELVHTKQQGGNKIGRKEKKLGGFITHTLEVPSTPTRVRITNDSESDPQRKTVVDDHAPRFAGNNLNYPLGKCSYYTVEIWTAETKDVNKPTIYFVEPQGSPNDLLMLTIKLNPTAQKTKDEKDAKADYMAKNPTEFVGLRKPSDLNGSNEHKASTIDDIYKSAFTKMQVIFDALVIKLNNWETYSADIGSALTIAKDKHEGAITKDNEIAKGEEEMWNTFLAIAGAGAFTYIKAAILVGAAFETILAKTAISLSQGLINAGIGHLASKGVNEPATKSVLINLYQNNVTNKGRNAFSQIAGKLWGVLDDTQKKWDAFDLRKIQLDSLNFTKELTQANAVATTTNDLLYEIHTSKTYTEVIPVINIDSTALSIETGFWAAWLPGIAHEEEMEVEPGVYSNYIAYDMPGENSRIRMIYCGVTFDIYAGHDDKCSQMVSWANAYNKKASNNSIQVLPKT